MSDWHMIIYYLFKNYMGSMENCRSACLHRKSAFGLAVTLIFLAVTLIFDF